MTDEPINPNVRKYTGATRDHPLMRAALSACDDREFADALCDFIDAEARADGVSGPDVVDALRVIAGTLCDMGWMLKD